MQSTPKSRRRLGYNQTRNGIPYYRRPIPSELRHLFPGNGKKTEFVRRLQTISYAAAHAEFEAYARGEAPVVGVQAAASAADLSPVDLAGLRHLAATGGDVLARAEELDRIAASLRTRVTLGLVPDEAAAAALEQTAVLKEQAARVARGEKIAAPVTLKAAGERFLATVTAAGTVKQYRPRIADIVEALGETRDIRDVTRADCRTFAQTTVHGIPAHWRKKWPSLSLPQAMEKGAEIGAPMIAHETKYGFVTLLRRFFAWAEEEGLIDASPATSAPTPKGRRGKRSDFSTEHLRTIFDSAPFSPDQRDVEPGMFWLPLLGLFTGARRDELVMLRKEDMKRERGVAFLDLREDAAAGRTLKNVSSIRQVPLHPELVAIGLPDYVAALPAGSFMFPELHKAKRPGDAFGKTFGKWLDGLGIDDRALTFHSFRHTFSTGARESGIEKRFADRIGGWSTGGAAEGYGSYPLTTLAREIAKLHYDIDLTHLRRAEG